MRLGAETVPQVLTPGWLVDVAPREAGDVLGPEVLDGLDVQPGDAVVFHTGWGRRWDEPDAYLAGEPGPGMALAERLAALGVAHHRLRHVELRAPAAGGPGPAVRRPPGPQRPPRRVHRREPRPRRAAAAGVRRFALVLTHPKLRGATGAWTSPIALI